MNKELEKAKELVQADMKARAEFDVEDQNDFEINFEFKVVDGGPVLRPTTPR